MTGAARLTALNRTWVTQVATLGQDVVTDDTIEEFVDDHDG